MHFVTRSLRYERLLEPLLLVVRFDDPALRANIFRRFVSITATLDLPYLRELALNMVSTVEADPNSVADVQIRAGVLALRECIDTHLSEVIVEEKIDQMKGAATQQVRSISYC